MLKPQTRISSLEAGSLCFEPYSPAGSVLLRRKETGERLISTTDGCPFAPIIDGKTSTGTLNGVELSDSAVVMSWEFPFEFGIANFKFHLEQNSEHEAFDLWCEFTATRDCQINAIDLFPQGTLLNLFDAVNFRNRHYTSNMWPELALGAEFQTSTYSDDWQFAPHPAALILRKGELSLFMGALDLQATFGLHLQAKKYRVVNWRLDYGPHPHGQILKQGEPFASQRMRLFMRENLSVYEMFAEFGKMLIADGFIADPAKKQRFDWWKEPLYCTWSDQRFLSNAQVAVELIDQTGGEENTAIATLNEDLVRRAVKVIQQEQLPIRTILLDDGWAVARGDWRPHPKRFPNLRGLVDELHAQGFKVMVWWNWTEVADEASVEPRYLVDEGWRSKHGSLLRDYSNPATQNEYLIPLMRQLMSSDPGCYDLDGVKTDFLADKIHSETPLFDPSWRGEEQYFVKITELFYREMKRHKKDAMHLAGSGNYRLAEFIDLNRTYDVHSSNWMEHEERGRMLAATAPGALVSYDMMVVTENTPRWFDSARRCHAAVEIGNVLAVKDDIASEPRCADPEYWAMLREELRKSGPFTK